VPHPEVGLILANGISVGFDYRLQPGDRISVYPTFSRIDTTELSQVFAAPPFPLRFVLDGHLGRLASYLRLLGFDTLYERDHDDAELARLAAEQGRILLSRDRGLLKRRHVRHGFLPRSEDPRQQLLEVAERYGLAEQMTPWTRCPRCNGLVDRVDKAAVAEQLPTHTRLGYSSFHVCTSCGRVYWKGAHHRRIQALLEAVRNLQVTVHGAIPT
jgi:hypothetical protein